MEWMAGDSPSELMSVSSDESNRKLLDMVRRSLQIIYSNAITC